MLLQAKFESQLFRSKSLITQAFIILLASLVLAAASQLMIPWEPVPFTFQSAMVVMLGLSLGSRRASLAVALYLAEAVVGLPVLAGFTSGLPILFGSTAGYLFGFLPAAFVAGWLMENGMAKSWVTTMITALISAAIIFVCGITHLAMLLGFSKAVTLGLMPFVITEPVKLMIASALAARCWK